MYLAGHEHSAEHLRYFEGNDIDYVISGNGGAWLSAYNPDNEDILNGMGIENLHFTADYGFAG